MEMLVTTDRSTSSGRASAPGGGFLRKRYTYQGAQATAKVMNQLLKQARSRDCIRNLAMQATANIPSDAAGFPDRRNKRNIAKAIYNFLKGRIAYVLDPFRVEHIQSPSYTLDKGTGDCDDMSLLAASMLQSLGVGTRFILAAPSGSEHFTHVYLEFKDRNNQWVPFDLTLGTHAGDEITGIGRKMAIYDNDQEEQLGWWEVVVGAVGQAASAINGDAQKQERAAKAMRDGQIAAAEAAAERSKMMVQVAGLTGLTAIAGLLIYKFT